MSFDDQKPFGAMLDAQRVVKSQSLENVRKFEKFRRLHQNEQCSKQIAYNTSGIKISGNISPEKQGCKEAILLSEITAKSGDFLVRNEARMLEIT